MPSPKTTQQKSQPKTQPKPEVPPKEDLGQGYITGNLTQDPELRYTPEGTAVCSLNVAENQRIQNDDGKWVDGETTYYRVNAWRSLGERCADTLERGDRVVVTGSFSKRFWVDREDNIRESLEINAQDVGASLLFRSAHIDRTQRSKSY